MDFNELLKKAEEIRVLYAALNDAAGRRQWGAREYTDGLVGDSGDLLKLIMARENFRQGPDHIFEEIKHEIVDCFWSILEIASEYGMRADDFSKGLDELKSRVQRELNQQVRGGGR